MWWFNHLWIIALQIIAFIPYIVGSKKFHRGDNKYFHWLVVAILLDIIMAISPALMRLPRMQADQGAPWASILFIAHIIMASIGMFGFIAVVIYVSIKGKRRFYPRLATFQYRVLLPCWIIGVIISLANFFTKVVYGVRLYDFM